MGRIEISYLELRKDELSAAESKLLEASRQALVHSYAPYSQLHVASALELNDGSVITGTNQENAAYPSGLCAERVAFFTAGSHADQPIRRVMVIAQRESGELVDAYPCGGCRQVMLEYAMKQEAPISILLRTSDSAFLKLRDVRDLLPLHFDSRHVSTNT